MSSVLMLSLVLVAGNDNLAPRLQTLSGHVDRLEAISVPPALKSEKEAKLTELRKRLHEGVKDEQAFNNLYLAIDDVRMWLWQHAAERPERAAGSFQELADQWQITTPDLKLTINRSDLAMKVQTGGATWQFLPSSQEDIAFQDAAMSLTSAQRITAAPLITGYSVGCIVTFEQFPGQPEFTLRWTVFAIGKEVVFDLAAHDTDAVLKSVRWPKAIELGNAASDLTVIPRMQGMLIPGNWPQAISAEDLTNSRTFYLPWWGQIHDGHGVQAILETSADAGGRYVHPAGGPTRVAPLWYATLGKFGYLRTIRYVFDDAATYVTMAKRFRRYVQEHGDFVPLSEKRMRTLRWTK